MKHAINSKLIIRSLLLSSLLSSAAYADYKPKAEFSTNPEVLHKHMMRTQGIEVGPKNHVAPSGVHSHTEAIQPFTLHKVVVESTSNLDEQLLHNIYQPYLNTQVTHHELDLMTRAIVKAYIKAGYLLPRPYMSLEDMTSGTLKIKLTLDSLHDVAIIGDAGENRLVKHYAEEMLKSQPASIKTIQKYLGLINKLPGIRAHYELKQEQPDQRDPANNPIALVLITQQKHGEAYVHLDNSGLKKLGRYQGSALLQGYSLLRQNDSVTLHSGATDKLNRFNSLSLGYDMPINNYGTRAGLTGSYSKDNPSKVLATSTKDNKIKSIGGHVSHYLLLNSKKSWEASLGLTHTKTSSYSSHITPPGKHSDARYTHASLSSIFKYVDHFGGKNHMDIAYHRGLAGKVTNYINPEDVFKKKYNVVKANYFREHYLVGNFSYYTHISGSYSNQSLPGQELFTIGGHNLGRGYKTALLSGNKGVGGSLETRYDLVTEHQLVKKIQAYLFADAAKVFNKPKLTGMNSSMAASAGPGMRLSLAYDISANCEVAFPLKKRLHIQDVPTKASTTFNFLVSKSFVF